ncbi:MAG: flavin reductase family protein [Clostridiales bacterium]|nr:flavin reductase family protein [Clostridiales bacterium]
MKEIPATQIANTVLEQLGNGGVFLCTADEEQRNVMTIGWGGVTRFCNELCFLAPVRASRHTFGILKRNPNFTVSVPLHAMRAELAFAGSKSGRDVNKFEGHGITAAPAQAVNVPIVAECELHIECEPVASAEMPSRQVEAAMLERWYPTRDMHTYFIGKIVRCYYTDDAR